MNAYMGESSLFPAAVILLSLCLGIRPGKAIRSGMMIGVGFVGIGLIVDMINSQIGMAATAMSARFGLHLNIIDLGWQGAASMAWASSLAAVAIPVAVLVNLILLGCKLTRTVNIDIWNIWHMIFTGMLAYIVTGNPLIGIGGIAIHAALACKLGDLWAPFIDHYFGLTGLTGPHGTSAYMAPIACLIDLLIDRIPVVNRIDFSMDKLQEKAGVFAEPMMIGALMGIGIGLLAGFGLDQAIPLGIEMAAVMILMPKIVKCIMEGLMPLSERIKELLTKHFGNGEFYIGLDPSVLLGDSQVVAAGLMFVPLTLVIAFLVPGNQILPFGDLATISFFITVSVAIHKGNLFRTMISGSVIMYMTLWITNQMIPWTTALGRMTGTITADQMTAAMDQGGSPITYVVIQLLTGEQMGGLVVISGIYFLGLAAAVYCSRREKMKD